MTDSERPICEARTQIVDPNLSMLAPGSTAELVEKCPTNCKGPNYRTVEKRLFGFVGPMVERTVVVCPMTGDERMESLLIDLTSQGSSAES